MGVDEDGQPRGARVGFAADLDACGASRAEQRTGVRRDHLVLVRTAEGAVVRAVENAVVGTAVGYAEGAAEEFPGAVDDVGHGAGAAREHGLQGGGEVRLGGGVHALDQDLDLATAGQADGEGVVVGVAEAGANRWPAVCQDVPAQVVDRRFDTAAGDAPDRGALRVDGEGAADGQGCAAADVGDGGEGEGTSPAVPLVQGVRDVQHRRPPWVGAPSPLGIPGWSGECTGRPRAQSSASAVMGRWRMRRPVALNTAFAMAGATPTMTISPRPLTPIGSASKSSPSM